MPRNETAIDVLVSSPGDLTNERRVVRDVIDDWNATWSRERGVRLNSLAWETDTFPDAGIDAQDVINRQLGDEYDIFLGLLWARFGTPTKRAESGTEEEFDRAFERHSADPTNVKIMMYFKTAPIATDSDVGQLKRVQEFRGRLEESGVLYHKFQDLDEFARLLRMHLSKQVQQWMKPQTAEMLDTSAVESQRAQAASLSSSDESEDLEEEGFLDLVEAGAEGFRDLTQQSESLSTVISDYGAAAQDDTKRLSELPPDNISARKKILKESALTTLNFAESVENFTSGFRDSYAQAMDSYGKATALLVDFEPEDSSQVLEASQVVSGVRSSMETTREQIGGFREALQSMPRVTTEHNKARKRAVAAVLALENEMEVAINSAHEVEALMAEIIEKIDDQVARRSTEESS